MREEEQIVELCDMSAEKEIERIERETEKELKLIEKKYKDSLERIEREYIEKCKRYIEEIEEPELTELKILYNLYANKKIVVKERDKNGRARSILIEDI